MLPQDEAATTSQNAQAKGQQAVGIFEQTAFSGREDLGQEYDLRNGNEDDGREHGRGKPVFTF